MYLNQVKMLHFYLIPLKLTLYSRPIHIQKKDMQYNNNQSHLHAHSPCNKVTSNLIHYQTWPSQTILVSVVL